MRHMPAGGIAHDQDCGGVLHSRRWRSGGRCAGEESLVCLVGSAAVAGGEQMQQAADHGHCEAGVGPRGRFAGPRRQSGRPSGPYRPLGARLRRQHLSERRVTISIARCASVPQRIGSPLSRGPGEGASKAAADSPKVPSGQGLPLPVVPGLFLPANWRALVANLAQDTKCPAMEKRACPRRCRRGGLRRQ